MLRRYILVFGFEILEFYSHEFRVSQDLMCWFITTHTMLIMTGVMKLYHNINVREF